MTAGIELLGSIVGILISATTLAGWIVRRMKARFAERDRQRVLLEKIAADVEQLKRGIQSS